jgi:hypothetical protein
MPSLILFVSFLLATLTPAHASGAVWCNAEDASLTFAMRSGLSRGIAGGFLNFEADLTVKLKGVPEDFRQLPFEEAAVSQRWLDDKAFKLWLVRERDGAPGGYLVLVVETTRIAEGDYRGRYDLTVSAMASDRDYNSTQWAARGKVSCATE